jgi:hypothetical protein
MIFSISAWVWLRKKSGAGSSVRRRKPAERGARHVYGGPEGRMPHRLWGLRSRRSANRHRPEMSGLRPWSQHDRRFAQRRSKTDIEALDWVFAGRDPAPARWRFRRKQGYRGQSLSGPEQRPPTYRARRSPSAPGWRANRRRKRPTGRLSSSTEQIVAGAS